MPQEQPGRPDETEFAPHAKPYVALVPNGNLLDLLAAHQRSTTALLQKLDDGYASTFAYAPGKWTVKQTLGHITDTERIFSVRALRLARNDRTPLPGFEQNDYVAAADANERSLADLLDEFHLVRASTLALLKSFSAANWMQRGIANNRELSVRGIGFTIAGHELHHVQILHDRYRVGSE